MNDMPASLERERSSEAFTNAAAYKFAAVPNPAALRDQLCKFVAERDLCGTILISTEGINLFVAGPDDEVTALLKQIRSADGFDDLEAKISFSAERPFRRMHIKVKREIIAFGMPSIEPAQYTSRKIRPELLQEWLDEGRDITLLDVRNDYEVRLGTFEGAVPIHVDNFRALPQATERLAEDAKHKPLVMFCTGGIRCEKAGPFMEQAGFQDVYQLDGGILKYFEKCGSAHYHGDCFVFDHRVAVDPDLQETDAKLCFVCRSPLTREDQASPHYVPSESCPYCYVTPAKRMQAQIESRQRRLAELTQPLPGSTPYENRRFITVRRELDGILLVDYLMEIFPIPGLPAWQDRIRQGLVRREGVALQENSIVAYGDRIENVFPDTVEPEVNCNIQIVYEDDSIVVVNKPAPLPMHPCGRFNRNSLSWILNEVYRPQKMRLAHRLDANTTGVVVFSRTKNVARTIQTQFHEDGQVQKSYVLRVHGHPSWDAQICTAPIGRAEADQVGARMVTKEGGVPARTDFHILQREQDGTALLRAHPVTGRTNQIRVHSWHLGFPIVGDPTYLADGEVGRRQTLSHRADCMCLHAERIEFDHPDGQRVAFVAPLPEWAKSVNTVT